MLSFLYMGTIRAGLSLPGTRLAPVAVLFDPAWSACQQAGGSPAATHFLLRRQKKVSKEKATPLSATPFAFATGATCGARSSRGRARTRSAQTIARPDPAGPALLGAARRGVGSRPDSPSGSGGDALCATPPPRIRIRMCPPIPLGWAEERRLKRIRARDCLSRRRVRARPRFDRAPKVARSEAAGPRLSGRLFFGDFLLATQKKVTCRRATPGLLAHPRPEPKVAAATRLFLSIRGYKC